MKINQWTLGLAAVGVVSLASAVNAEESMNAVQTALSATTISGYVDTSLNWNSLDSPPGDGANDFLPFSQGGTKNDGFNLNVIGLTLQKAMDESEYASGYKVDLLFGPDAVGYNSSVNGDSTSDFAIKQAYVELRTPVGNGIDWKMGVFDTIIGYEVFESYKNPNFTRSWGYAIEPTEHTGVLGSYRVSDAISVSGGIANTETAGINARDEDQWDKTWLGSVALTAPEDMGFLSGSTLYGGVVLGSALDQDNYYLGATMNTPIEKLKAGLAYDYADNLGGYNGDAQALSLYLSYQATEKLTMHGRVEYTTFDDLTGTPAGSLAETASGQEIVSLTGTVQYDLWKNVISRAEFRYDEQKGNDGESAGSAYLNIVYVF